MRRLLIMVAATAVLLVGVGAALALPPFTTAPKAAPAAGSGQAEVFGLAVGCHPTYDRLVLRTRLATPGYDVRYATAVVTPSGRPLSLLGTRKLKVVVRPARGHTAGGTNLLPAVRTPLCANLRQVKVAEDFEGVVVLGVGLAHTAGFRVFRLTAPGRIVVDVAH